MTLETDRIERYIQISLNHLSSLCPILHFHRSQILIMSSTILISSVFSPLYFGWHWWFGGQAAEDSCTARHWKRRVPSICHCHNKQREAMFSFMLTEWSSRVSVSLFPAAAPLLNVRQTSKPTHWLLGAVLLLLAYLGWKPLGTGQMWSLPLSFWIYNVFQDHYYCMNICLPSVHIVYIICMCICLTYVFNFQH